MHDANSALITRFYQAFQRLDGEAMVACYAPDVLFSDPVFGTLRGRDAADMWRMLTARAKGFSLWKWSAQALGLKGQLLGWSPLVQGRIRAQASKGLRAYQARGRDQAAG